MTMPQFSKLELHEQYEAALNRIEVIQTHLLLHDFNSIVFNLITLRREIAAVITDDDHDNDEKQTHDLETHDRMLEFITALNSTADLLQGDMPLEDYTNLSYTLPGKPNQLMQALGYTLYTLTIMLFVASFITLIIGTVVFIPEFIGLSLIFMLSVVSSIWLPDLFDIIEQELITPYERKSIAREVFDLGEKTKQCLGQHGLFYHASNETAAPVPPEDHETPSPTAPLTFA